MSTTITRDTATPALARIYDQIAPGRRKALMGVLGRQTEKEYRAWFRSRNADSPNKEGFPRSNFWSKRIANATAYDPAKTTDTKAVVVISDPAIKAKVYGGSWGAKEAKNLAIPLRGEVYGVFPRAGTIPGLRFVPSQRGGNTVGWLASGEGKETVYWWRLQRRVTVAADARALPPKSRVQNALSARALAFFFRPKAGGVS
ncbi:hypothetical protein [Opitutus sp. ER46]|uniref:hypothetical protein n=1 Tax=Opitutus sp. ER46 TaxID=2161864 RepID=UPI000D30EA72|nr:hypothetical protein [Opitutus sp. ER46]PTX95765.1 hypothetical protein DB354_10160 [Opitutus sp. ER46]